MFMSTNVTLLSARGMRVGRLRVQGCGNERSITSWQKGPTERTSCGHHARLNGTAHKVSLQGFCASLQISSRLETLNLGGILQISAILEGFRMACHRFGGVVAGEERSPARFSQKRFRRVTFSRLGRSPRPSDDCRLSVIFILRENRHTSIPTPPAASFCRTWI